MKILELRLIAFGPFRGRSLDLSGGRHGLHVIYGPNEAGKSSALRALHALLYGIPGQTDDAFLHPYPQLRVGARVRHSTGEILEFSRRKANKGSLLGPADERLDDAALDRFLGGVGPDQFRMFWGIDHGRLIEGGREILEGHGDLGASLFAAGSGASHLGSLRRKLEEEAAELFAPRGHNRTVNQAVNRLRDLRREQRDSTVSAEEWARHDEAARSVVEVIRKLTSNAHELEREKSSLHRVKRVLPLLAERAELQVRLDGLAGVVRLAPDFPKRRIDAELALRAAESSLARAEAETVEQVNVIENLGATPRLAAEIAAVTELHERLGSHRKALRDRPRLVGQRGEQRELARRLLSELRPDMDVGTAESLRVFVGRRARIQKLAAERERLDERVGAASDKRKAAERRAEAPLHNVGDLPPVLDSAGLVSAIEAARGRGDAESERNKLARSLERSVAQRDALSQKLGLSASVVERVAALRVPTAATMALFEGRAKDIEDQGRTACAERLRLEAAVRTLGSKIETAHSKRSVPTEGDLLASRELRDNAFGLLREQWEDGRDVASEARLLLGEGQLVSLYRSTVKSADGVADRMRTEADRVAELAQQIEEHQRIGLLVKDLDLAEGARTKVRINLDADWRAAWIPELGEPPTVHDARAWRDDFARLVERQAEMVEFRQQLEDMDGWIESRTTDLGAAILASDPRTPPVVGLSSNVSVAEQLRLKLDKGARMREDHARETREAVQSISDGDAAIKSARGELDDWRMRWSEATQGLVHGEAPPPDDALLALERIDRILRALDDAAGFQARIVGIDREAAEFQSGASALADRLGDTEAIRPGAEDVWVESLHGRLAEVVQEDERRRQANARLEEVRAETAVARRAIGVARDAVAALRVEVGSVVDADFVAAEQRSDEARRCEIDLGRVERDLLRNGDGAPIAAIAREAESVDRDGIDTRLSAVGAELLEIERTLAGARDVKAGAQAELARMAGPSVASERAEDVQALLASLRESVMRYARLRVASAVLARRIDDYRRKNQAPLLCRAGALFSRLTLGTFERLEADIEDDKPILVALRAGDGRRVPAQGMSEGTRDQLFFALRLAAVEASCATSEPLPFVVDDVLVQFDDDRSEAALRVLAEVAAQTQVILLTHHRHVRDSADLLRASADVVVHDL